MRVLHEALTPPDGYELDLAVGTTFTLDLVSLLSIPLAAGRFAEGENGPAEANPLALLASLERSIDKITIFHQAGEIRRPDQHRDLLILVESCLASVSPGKGRLFHPKVWICRYVSRKGPIQHRVVVLSRNLTPDRSWDTMTVLEGKHGRAVVEGSKPVSDFVRWLARRPGLGRERRTSIDDLSRTVARARFQPPSGFDSVRFRPLGVPGYTNNPVTEARRDRVLVVSPFIGGNELRALSSGSAGSVLVTRPEELSRMGEPAPAAFSSVLQLDEGLEAEPDENFDGASGLVGLHAKLYCADQGWNATVWTGSSNATGAGFGSNVEFLVEMEGRKSTCGVEAVLGAESPGTFSTMLRPIEELPDVIDDDAEQRLDALAALIAGLPIEVRVTEHDSHWELALHLTEHASLPGEIDVRVTPLASTITARALHLDQSPVAKFAGLEPHEVSGLFVVELTLRNPRLDRAFVARWPLVGDAPDRVRALLARLITDRERLIAFLRLLLGTGSGLGPIPGPGGTTTGDGAGWQGAFGAGTPPLELLVRTVALHPERLDSIARWIPDLAAAAGGQAEAELLAIWEPIWQARQEQR